MRQLIPGCVLQLLHHRSDTLVDLVALVRHQEACHHIDDTVGLGRSRLLQSPAQGMFPIPRRVGVRGHIKLVIIIEGERLLGLVRIRNLSFVDLRDTKPDVVSIQCALQSISQSVGNALVKLPVDSPVAAVAVQSNRRHCP